MSHFELGTQGCGTTVGGQPVCSCCQALAQLRQPSLDAHLISKLEALADAALGDGLKNLKKPALKPQAKVQEASTQEPKKGVLNSYISKVAAAANVIQEEIETPKADGIKSFFANHPYAKLWSSISGKAVMTFGVVVPALMLTLFTAFCAKRLTLVLLNHPLETVAELLLLLSIPFFNFRLWRAICTGKMKASLKRGLACGIAMSSSILVTVVGVASLFAGSSELSDTIGTGFSTGFMLIAMLAVASAIASSYIFVRFRNSLEFAQSKKSLTKYVSIGAVLPLVVLLVSEIGPWSVRVLERRAIVGNIEERKQTLDLLRVLNPERNLRMECGDSRAAGLCGMFLPIKPSAQHELYFAITGQPYAFRSYANNDMSSMPDDYVSRHVVGDKIAGLSLVRSVLSGNIHANTLTSTMDWIFVLKNSSTAKQEVRAEVGLPSGAVVTKATFWHSGNPHDLKTVSFESDTNQYGTYAGDYTVTDLGRGRVLLQCQAIPQDEELKVRLTVVSPLKSEGKEAAVVLPHLIATNFDHAGEQQLKLTANRALSSVAKNLVPSSSEDRSMLVGNLTIEQLEGGDPGISVARGGEALLPAVALDTYAMEIAEEDAKAEAATAAQENSDQTNSQVTVMIDGNSGIDAEQIAKLRLAMNKKDKKQPQVEGCQPRYVVENMVSSHSAAPEHVVVVLDGSVTMSAKLNEIKDALRPLQQRSSVSLILASQEHPEFGEAMPLDKALAVLKPSDFAGGQDNLKAVVQGAELAGQTPGGAVLWVHGPQPVLNQEIYILTPYAAKPTFYELPVDIGPIDTFEFFKNHSEIGPFTQIAYARGKNDKANLLQTMNGLYTKWDPQNTELVSKFAQSLTCPSNRQDISEAEATEIAALYASDECVRLIDARNVEKAKRIAVKYGIVSQVSCLTSTRAASDESSSSNDSTIVRGVNTAGTVRVNNLANLEALLNIIANMGELLFAGAGLLIVLEAFFVKGPVGQVFGLRLPYAPVTRAGIGFAAIFLGLTVPGMINWFVASARDANLFS